MLLIDFIYKKLRTVDQLPRRGKRIPIENQNHWLGEYISKFPGGYELWRIRQGLSTGYSILDPDTRKVELYLSGTRFKNNPRSFKIYGIYARPNNRVRAIQLYEFLIKKQNLIIISDNTQSPGGQRIWKQLHRKNSICTYGWNFKTNKCVDISNGNLKDIYVTPRDIERAEPGKIQELKGRARNIRLVACAV
jgi:hypothetical protein